MHGAWWWCSGPLGRMFRTDQDPGEQPPAEPVDRSRLNPDRRFASGAAPCDRPNRSKRHRTLP